MHGAKGAVFAEISRVLPAGVRSWSDGLPGTLVRLCQDGEEVMVGSEVVAGRRLQSSSGGVCWLHRATDGRKLQV